MGYVDYHASMAVKGKGAMAGLRYRGGRRVEPGDVCEVVGDPDRDAVTVRGVDPERGLALCEWRGRAANIPVSALKRVGGSRRPVKAAGKTNTDK